MNGRAVAALAVVAVAIRLPALGRASLWFDELLEVERATGPWRALWFGRGIDHDPPLFALALRGWIALGRSLGWPWRGAWAGAPTTADVAALGAGWAEAWLRLPSVALGVVAVVATAVWAGRAVGPRVGWTAGLLVAVAPLAVHQSREVNQYAAMIALTPLLLLAHDRLAAGRATRGAWLAYAALSAAALATHYGLVFPLLALGLDLAWRAWRRPGHHADRLGVAGYAAAMAAVTLALFALGLGDRLAVPHVQPRLWGTHLAKELAYIGDVGWREIVVYFAFPFAGGPAIAVANALGVAALAGAVALWRGGGAGRRLVGPVLGGTLAMTYATSVVGWYPLGYRYGLFNLVPYLVCVAAGIAALAERIARARPDRPRTADGAVAALLAPVVVACAAFWPHAPWPAARPYIHVPREDARAVLRAVAAAWRPGDRLVAVDGAAAAVRFYWRGAADDVAVLPPVGAGGAAPGDDLRRAVSTALDGSRAWLVVVRSDDAEAAALRAALDGLGRAVTPAVAADGATAWRIDDGRAGRP